MTGFPSLSRVTETRLTTSLEVSIQRSLQSLAREEQRISSGRKYATLADAPLATRRIVSMERLIERNEKFQANISLADSRLAATESSLSEMQELIIRGREIALSQINATATDETREGASVEISFLVDELVTLANRKFGDRYLFGGYRVDSVPFERTGNYVSYLGDDGESSVEVAEGMFAADSVSGVRAFGAWSSEIRGRTDLDPLVTVETPLRALNGGRGVRAGEIEIRDGTSSVYVDLSGANKVGDVIDAINASGFATAALDAAGTGIEISKAGADLSVLDVNGGRAATDLGLLASGAGALLAGDDLDPAVLETTLLSELRGGLGIDAADFTITNGEFAATIDVAGLTTVEDLLNAIRRSGTSVVARISDSGRGLNVSSALSGAGFRIEEGSGTAAADLGFIVPSEDVEITRLNNGAGIAVADGADFRITLGDGTVLDIDVSNAAVLGDVADLINADPDNGGLLLAEVVAGEDRLRLTDLSGGPGEPTVMAIGGSYAASGLGILGTGVAGVIEGSDLEPGAHRVNTVFDGMALLSEGLTSSDVGLMERAMAAFDVAESALLDTRAEIGTRIRRLEISDRRMETETFEVRSLLSEEGDTDLAETLMEFNRQQTVLQASLQTASQLLQQTLLDFLALP